MAHSRAVTHYHYCFFLQLEAQITSLSHLWDIFDKKKSIMAL